MAHYLKPVVFDKNRPFSPRQAAHLLRRAGFGAPPAAVDHAVEVGLEATIDELLDKADDEEAEFDQTFTAVQGLVDFGDVGYLQAWWALRMAQSKVPLREKLALFWHGHFATSVRKVEDTNLMQRQLATIRRLGAESFRDLALAIAQDPAMLVYLDGESNTQQHPNENFARELMELFTCGIGHYTERDVQEAARAFSGWQREGDAFVFREDAHDTGRKEFLGQAGRFDGTDIVDLLVQQPATSRRIAERLLRFFATPDPKRAVVDEAAQLLDRTQLNIKWFLRSLLMSDYFFSPDCYRTRITSPAEFVVGTVRTLGARVAAVYIKDYVASLGQDLFMPPSVKGWDGERDWINSSTWTKRIEFANFIANLSSENPLAAHLPIDELVSAELTTPKAVVARLSEVLLQGDLSSQAAAALADLAVQSDEGSKLEQFRDDEEFRRERTRVVLAAMLSLPECQMC